MDEAKRELTEREVTIERINEFLENSGCSQQKLAEQAGISAGTVSGIRKGTYEGDFDGMVQKIMSVILKEEEKLTAKLAEPAFTSTSVYRNFTYMLNITQTDGGITILTGESGIGKTISLKMYHSKHPQTILIELTETSSLKSILSDICGTLHIPPSASVDGMFRAIVERTKGSDRMLIVDEADSLHSKSKAIKVFNTLRRIYDMAGIPIALVGLEGLLEIINATVAAYQQIYSRMLVVNISKITKEDTAELVASTIGDQPAEMNDEFYAHSKGSARKLTRLLVWSQRIARQNNIGITKNVIRTAAEMLL